jgi:phosphoglycolate phosphatase
MKVPSTTVSLPRAVLFDFDFTLADSSRGAHACINYALTNLGLPEQPRTHTDHTIGLSLPETLRSLTGINDRDTVDAFGRSFVEHADRVMADLVVFYPGVLEMLTTLRHRGVLLGIVTTKYRRRIDHLLARDGMAPLMDLIVGGDEVENPKPDPEGIMRALRELDVLPEDAIYVGDSQVDGKAASAADVAFVGVLSGTTEEAELRQWRPLFILPTAADLVLRALGATSGPRCSSNRSQAIATLVV